MMGLTKICDKYFFELQNSLHLELQFFRNQEGTALNLLQIIASKILNGKLC
jgi:hypothetical protein